MNTQPDPEATERSLVRLAQRGDQAAMSRLFELHRRQLRAIARDVAVRLEWDVKDAEQEAAVLFLGRVRRHDPARGPLGATLWRFLRPELVRARNRDNLVYTTDRAGLGDKRGIEPTESLAHEPLDHRETDPQLVSFRAEHADLLSAALAFLTDEERTILVALGRNGRTRVAVANELGCSPQYVGLCRPPLHLDIEAAACCVSATLSELADRAASFPRPSVEAARYPIHRLRRPTSARVFHVGCDILGSTKLDSALS